MFGRPSLLSSRCRSPSSPSGHVLTQLAMRDGRHGRTSSSFAPTRYVAAVEPTLVSSLGRLDTHRALSQTTRQLSRACAGASNASLPAPPGFHNYLARRDGPFDSNLDALPEAQSYLYTGWREASAFGKAFMTSNYDFWSSLPAFGPIVNMACTSLMKDFPDAEQRILLRDHDRCAGQNPYLLASLIRVAANFAPEAAMLAREHYRMWPMGHVAERTCWTLGAIHRVGQALLQEFGAVLLEASTCPDKQKATVLQVWDLILQYGAVGVISRVVTTMAARYVTCRLLSLALVSLSDPCLRLYNRSIRGPLRSRIRYGDPWQGFWFWFILIGFFLFVRLGSNSPSEPMRFLLAMVITQILPEPRNYTLDSPSPEKCLTCGRADMELELAWAERSRRRNESKRVEEGTGVKSLEFCQSCEILPIWVRCSRYRIT